MPGHLLRVVGGTRRPRSQGPCRAASWGGWPVCSDVDVFVSLVVGSHSLLVAGTGGHRVGRRGGGCRGVGRRAPHWLVPGHPKIARISGCCCPRTWRRRRCSTESTKGRTGEHGLATTDGRCRCCRYSHSESTARVGLQVRLLIDGGTRSSLSLITWTTCGLRWKGDDLGVGCPRRSAPGRRRLPMPARSRVTMSVIERVLGLLAWGCQLERRAGPPPLTCRFSVFGSPCLARRSGSPVAFLP